MKYKSGLIKASRYNEETNVLDIVKLGSIGHDNVYRHANVNYSIVNSFEKSLDRHTYYVEHILKLQVDVFSIARYVEFNDGYRPKSEIIDAISFNDSGELDFVLLSGNAVYRYYMIPKASRELIKCTLKDESKSLGQVFNTLVKNFKCIKFSVAEYVHDCEYKRMQYDGDVSCH